MERHITWWLDYFSFVGYRVISDWANEPGRNLGPYKTKKMEDTTFLDLTLQLGQPYLYMHQGDCEHLIIFSDIR
mgnify:CR=1 FL=1